MSERAVDRLIAIEWDIIRDLEGQLEVVGSQEERVRLANSLAYHVNTLNKLLVRRDGLPVVDEESLVEVISRFPLRLSRAVGVCVRVLKSLVQVEMNYRRLFQKC